MDFEDLVMRFLLIAVCFFGPVVFLKGEISFIKVVLYEMLKIDIDIWDPVLPFLFFRKL